MLNIDAKNIYKEFINDNNLNDCETCFNSILETIGCGITTTSLAMVYNDFTIAFSDKLCKPFWRKHFKFCRKALCNFAKDNNYNLVTEYIFKEIYNGDCNKYDDEEIGMCLYNAKHIDNEHVVILLQHISQVFVTKFRGYVDSKGINF